MDIKTDAAPAAPAARLLSFEDLHKKMRISVRQTRYKVAEPWFPAPLELGPRCLRWIEAEVDAALAARAPRRANPGPEPVQLLRGRIERMKATGEVTA